MKDLIVTSFQKIKEYWGKLAKKSKTILITLLVGIVVVALGATVYLQVAKSGYQVLFPNITTEESREIYAMLQSMDPVVDAQINSKGQVLVPKAQWDQLVFELAAKDYPKSAPLYDLFLQNTGFTKTEYEKKQILLFQTQDRIQETLKHIEGITGAVASITVPEESGYVWDKNNVQKSTASILVETEQGYELSSERVSAIKNLTAKAVPKLDPDSVSVVDARTGIEIKSSEGGSGGYDSERLKFERELEQDIVDKVKVILSPKYGADGVTAVATVKLNYDKMMTEKNELIPQENGDGLKTHLDEQYSINGQIPAAGLVGEENNTDVPIYNAGDGTGTGGVTDYNKSVDYDYSYIKTQIEKGNAEVTEKSVSVLVNDPALDTETHDKLVDLIAKGTSIDPTFISVTNIDLGIEPTPEPDPVEPEPFFTTRMIIILSAAAAAMLLVFILIIVLVSAHNKKKRRLLQEAAEQEALSRENELKSMQDDIENHKRALSQAAHAAATTKESAITDEIKSFTHENPEIAASLIRSWLKEEE